ncbi:MULTISPECIES: BadF/BadG/BcrA/BcrD ATPase family protein [unclassified Ochrobactrum]|uniref:BadF/BadG/BcrA/BcrD ATPase family protein n=1 Tax=unclassified Ochrobactrum TaxID=239106 RepID=UPI000DEF8432|nr:MULTISPECIES: BadF/BadG/BcrA/BcrD ATPase family protein [unclassified Ochrobactrum]MBQ0710527.1 ATPase [Ochrobactrum sp. AP1BH01-1]
MSMKPMPYILAVDGGGTGCRALLADRNGAAIGRGTSGPANIGADPSTALDNIMCAAKQAAHDAGLDHSILGETCAVLGLAGANSLADKDSVERQFPFGKVKIVSDAVTALQGALGEDDGAIVILGTGSVFVRRKRDAFEIVGGRGFMLSDHAGGARLGRELLEETLLVLDGMAERTALANAVLTQFGGELRQIIAFSRTATAADYAAFAPLVFDYTHKRDALGLSILQRACSYIARGLGRLDVETLGRFSLTGGLASSYAALPFLPHRGLYRPALGDALQGALSLALRENGRD